MTKARLVILRHGETPHNVNHIMSGQLETPLTEKGEAQAREAGKLIANIPFSKVYASNLSRTFNTAALALEMAGQKQPIEQRSEIAEIDAGNFAGKCMTDPVFAGFKLVYDVPVQGGESPKQVVERVRQFMDTEVTPRLKAGENVLVVAHEAVFYAFEIVLGTEKALADGQEVKMKPVANAAPAVYEYRNGKLKNNYKL